MFEMNIHIFYMSCMLLILLLWARQTYKHRVKLDRLREQMYRIRNRINTLSNKPLESNDEQDEKYEF